MALLELLVNREGLSARTFETEDWEKIRRMQDYVDPWVSFARFQWNHVEYLSS